MYHKIVSLSDSECFPLDSVQDLGDKGGNFWVSHFFDYLEVEFECTVRANYVLEKLHRYLKTRFNYFQTFAETT